jgi:hypothetical protein
MVNSRGIEGTRVLLGLLSLTKKHPHESLEKACETALSHGAYRLRTIRQLLARQAPQQEPLPFLDEHPIIRPLTDYAAVVARASARALSRAAIHRHADRPSVDEGFTRHGWTKECPASLAQRKRPDNPLVADRQGAADVPPPRSGYPSSGCSSAEPDSVWPDSSSVVHDPLSHQEPHHE